MDTASLSGLDSFPYRHRCAELMSGPVASVDPAATLAEAVRVMYERGVSSVLTLDGDGRAQGILTEKDVLRAMAIHGAEAGTHPVADYLSSPVAFVRANAFLYMALGRMARLNVRHLACIDSAGRAVGMLTARALLKLRSAESLQLGDRIADAADAAGMDVVRRELPTLAGHLFAEGVEAVQVAAVISAVYCDMTRRAAQLVVEAMAADGLGPAPAPWALLVLGSGGRGESLLAPDQDNAIVHAGSEADDPWFAEAGTRIAALLDAAGLPLCKGGVMASNPQWRKSLDGWRHQIDHWVRHPEPQSLLEVDIFYDFVAVYGDAALAEALRAEATEAARRSLAFLKLMAAQMEDLNPPLGLFGRFRTENGRVDLKKGGLLPLVRGARVMALQLGVPAPATRDRLAAAAAAGAITPRDHEALVDAQAVVAQVMLRQQIDDLAVGRAPTTWVDPNRFSTVERHRVKAAVKQCDALKMMVKDALTRPAAAAAPTPTPAPGAG